MDAKEKKNKRELPSKGHSERAQHPVSLLFAQIPQQTIAVSPGKTVCCSVKILSIEGDFS